MKTKRASYPLSSFKQLADEGDGVFEAVVAVFGNVDLHGDRIVAGAFEKSLKDWAASGDPIPVVYSHQWEDIDAHVGQVLEARELSAGDVRLPAAIRDMGGLYVKAQLDLEEEFARKLWKRMSRRLIKEFSFAYDINEEARASDGANELLEIHIIEAGPTLKGANPATQLLGVKDFLSMPDWSAVPASERARLAREFASALGVEGAAPAGAKAEVALAGSMEVLRDQLRAEVRAWAEEAFVGDVWWVYLEATFADNLVAYVELWDDPPDGGRFYQIAYEQAAGGEITLGEPVEVTITGSVAPKAGAGLARLKAAGRSSPAELDRIKGAHDLLVEMGVDCTTATAPAAGSKSEANADDRETGKAEEPRTRTPLAARIEAELAELEL